MSDLVPELVERSQNEKKSKRQRIVGVSDLLYPSLSNALKMSNARSGGILSRSRLGDARRKRFK